MASAGEGRVLRHPSASARGERNKVVHSLIPFSPKLCQLDNVGEEVTGTTADETPSFGFILNGFLFLFSILCCLV